MYRIYFMKSVKNYMFKIEYTSSIRHLNVWRREKSLNYELLGFQIRPHISLNLASVHEISSIN